MWWNMRYICLCNMKMKTQKTERFFYEPTVVCLNLNKELKLTNHLHLRFTLTVVD